MEKITLENIKEVVNQEGAGFSKKQLKNITAILKLIANDLSGKFSSCSSGGNFYHMFFQLNDNRWIWFHSGTGDITISDTFKTVKGVYNAFWDRQEKVTNLIPERHKCNGAGEFSAIKTISNDILNKKFKNVYE